MKDMDIVAFEDFAVTRTAGKTRIAVKLEVFVRGEEINVSFPADKAGMYMYHYRIRDAGHALEDKPAMIDAGNTLVPAKKVGDPLSGPMHGTLIAMDVR